MSGEQVRQILWKLAIINALEHGGRAMRGPVVRRLFAERKDLVGQIQTIHSLAEEIITQVNQKPLDEIRRIAGQFEVTSRGEKAKEFDLLPLPRIDKYERVVTRFAPNPDCVLHIGNLRALILSHDYARKYKGGFILRFDDTDPRLKRASIEFYDSIRDDMKWLGCIWDEECMQSDRLEVYYKFARTLIEDGHAYPCTCRRDEFKHLASASISCPCRELPRETSLERWEKMLDGRLREGEAVVRIRTSLTHPNPAVRDWPALRVIDPAMHPHPRIGSSFSVWPLYNFASAIDDHLLGITHVIRGKEHLANTERQIYLYRYLGWDYPEAVHYGRLRIGSGLLSKSAIRLKVETKEVSGYDDPSLPTIPALRRRGFSPEALRKIIHQVGPRPVDARLSWENIFAVNRKILDPTSHRFFFVADPVELRLVGVESVSPVEIKLHPDFPEIGVRTLIPRLANGEVHLYISGEDARDLQASSIFRLIGLHTAKVVAVSNQSIVAKVNDSHVESLRKVRLLQWVPREEAIRVELLMPDGKRIEGFGESNLQNTLIDQVLQLVRVGFARVDEKSDGYLRMVFTCD